MIELPLVFIGGLLGSAHCVGMCGGFAVLVGTPAARLPSNLARQVVYSCGRIFTYSVFGAAVGYGGLRLAENLGGVMNVQAVVAILAGVLLVVQGLIAAGVFRWLSRRWHVWRGSVRNPLAVPGAGVGCLMGGMLGSFLRDRRLRNVFLAGVFTGFLPCGLVYAYVALAAATSNLFGGMATMAAFGIGTVPLMVLAGSGSSLLSLAGRQRLLRMAAWCVVLTGGLSIVRGAGFWDPSHSETHSAAACPFCESSAAVRSDDASGHSTAAPVSSDMPRQPAAQ